MSSLKAVYDVYSEIQVWLGYEEIAADAGWPKIGINRCAYFILMFAQFEKLINNFFREMVGPPEDASFMHRVSVLSSSYHMDVSFEIMRYYEVRCEIAHGREATKLPFPMDEPYALFSDIAKALDLN